MLCETLNQYQIDVEMYCEEESTRQQVARRPLALRVHGNHHDHDLVLYLVHRLDWPVAVRSSSFAAGSSGCWAQLLQRGQCCR